MARVHGFVQVTYPGLGEAQDQERSGINRRIVSPEPCLLLIAPFWARCGDTGLTPEGSAVPLGRSVGMMAGVCPLRLHRRLRQRVNSWARSCVPCARAAVCPDERAPT